MLFSFLICEAKCDLTRFNITDRQNAYSITLTVKAIIELFKTVKREKKLYRKILAFSISYNHETIRIYKYYPMVNSIKTTIWRHLIRKFDFTELGGKEK
jgi:hypothetical protein